MPSKRNWFSLVPDPNADTVVTVPLAGEVGEMNIEGGVIPEVFDVRSAQVFGNDVMIADAQDGIETSSAS